MQSACCFYNSFLFSFFFCLYLIAIVHSFSGGQEAFMENYFSSQRDHIFRNVEVLIYVFDIESRENQRDLRDYRNCLEAILQVNLERKIYIIFSTDMKLN